GAAERHRAGVLLHHRQLGCAGRRAPDGGGDRAGPALRRSAGRRAGARGSETMKVAAVQMTSGRDVERNLAEARRLVAEAAAAGAELIVLPEDFSFLGAQEAERLAAAETPGDGPAQAVLADEARRHGVWIVGGTIPIRDRNDRASSRSYLMSPDGNAAAFYDKIHLFDVEIPGPTAESYRESATTLAGERVVTAETPLGRI